MYSCVDASSGPATPASNKYDYVEDWGEKYTGVSELGLFVLELSTGSITRVTGAGSAEETVGQPAFIPDGSGVVYTSWPTCPKKLGMIYCYQRSCSIKMASLDSGKVKTLTPHLRLARYPVFAPTGRLVFLGSESGFDMHNNSVKLFVFDLLGYIKHDLIISDENLTREYCKVVVDDVPGAGLDVPKLGADIVTVNGYPFPGLFAGALLPRSFLSDSLILVETQWRSYAVILCIDISSGDIRVLTFDDSSASLKISMPFTTLGSSSAPAQEVPLGDIVICNSWLTACPFSLSLVDSDISSGRAVFTVSSPTSAPRLALLTREDLVVAGSSGSSNGNVKTCMSDFFGNIAVVKREAGCAISSTVASSDGPIRSFILHSRLVHASYSTTIESILLLPPSTSAPHPLLVSPHGGPHSAFSTAYVAQYNYLCAIGGFAILMVNYRGSTVIYRSIKRLIS